MALRDASGSQKIVIFSNALVRFAQFIVAAAALGVYSQQKGYWVDHGIPSKITYELVVASLSLVTALAFALIPFFMSYRPVAFGAAWDIILMILWGAAFGLMKSTFLRSYQEGTKFYHHGSANLQDEINHWNTMVSAAYINLAGLILFLISGVMGLVLLVIGRRNAKNGGYA